MSLPKNLTSTLLIVGLAVAALSPRPGGQPIPARSTANDQAVVEDIDGNEYPVVTIGQQMWIAENLQVTRSPSGRSVTNYCIRD
jgi:hypothetical protein